MKKANYTEIPKVVEQMPDGYSLFRHNIQAVDNGFECVEVKIYGAVTADKVIAALILELWGDGVEQKLINDYNEYLLNEENEAAKVAYIEFLQQRKELKNFVKSAL